MKDATTPDIDPVIAEKGYAHPELLVSTEWLAAHLNDPNIRIIWLSPRESREPAENNHDQDPRENGNRK